MTVKLPAALYEKIIAHARAGLPDEACGLLGGTAESGVKTVREVYCLENTDESPEHFSMRPEDQFAALADMRQNNYSLLGNFHSHPATPARPSKEDMRLAFDPALSYIIVSLQNGGAVLKSFAVDRQNEKYTEEVCDII